MHVFSKTIMQYCAIEVREHPDFFLILIESTCVAIKKRNKFMTSNGKMWYHSDTMSEKMQKQGQQGRKKCWNNVRIDHKKSGISDTPYTPYLLWDRKSYVWTGFFDPKRDCNYTYWNKSRDEYKVAESKSTLR